MISISSAVTVHNISGAKKIKFEGNRPDTVSHTVILALFLRAMEEGRGEEIFVGGKVSPESSYLQLSIPSRYIYILQNRAWSTRMAVHYELGRKVVPISVLNGKKTWN